MINNIVTILVTFKSFEYNNQQSKCGKCTSDGAADRKSAAQRILSIHSPYFFLAQSDHATKSKSFTSENHEKTSETLK